MTHNVDEQAEAWFHRKATEYVGVQILYHLNQVGVWDLLRKEARHSQDLAAALELEPEVLDVMLEYIEGVDSILDLIASYF